MALMLYGHIINLELFNIVLYICISFLCDLVPGKIKNRFYEWFSTLQKDLLRWSTVLSGTL